MEIELQVRRLTELQQILLFPREHSHQVAAVLGNMPFKDPSFAIDWEEFAVRCVFSEGVVGISSRASDSLEEGVVGVTGSAGAFISKGIVRFVLKV